MPFYEYQCKRCGHHLEAMQKVSDPQLRKCPECGKPALTRLMSAPVFRLKGAGWYETDFKSDNEGKKNLADRPEAEAAKSETASPPAKDAKETKEAKPAEASTPAAGAADSKTQATKPAAAKPAARPARRATPAKGAKGLKKAAARRK